MKEVGRSCWIGGLSNKLAVLFFLLSLARVSSAQSLASVAELSPTPPVP